VSLSIHSTYSRRLTCWPVAYGNMNRPSLDVSQAGMPQFVRQSTPYSWISVLFHGNSVSLAPPIKCMCLRETAAIRLNVVVKLGTLHPPTMFQESDYIPNISPPAVFPDPRTHASRMYQVVVTRLVRWTQRVIEVPDFTLHVVWFVRKFGRIYVNCGHLISNDTVNIYDL
jgi:hypothetical protein